jgi:hypothetical protein
LGLKHYTVDEANRTLPLVRRIVGDIVSAHRMLLERIDEYRTHDPKAEMLAPRRRQLEGEMQDLTDRANEYVAELEEIGVVFKGFEDGLVDFHGMLDGRSIFLCWKLGEPSVEWWHEVDAGFAGRRRLPAHLLSAE